MEWPTLIVDNFFTDPHAVVKLSKTFKYKRDVENAWPGTRTLEMHKENNDFFLWSTKKIVALLYPSQVGEENTLTWVASQYFQRIPYEIHGDAGWIHNDSDSIFTVIIYLSNHSQSGTCLYEGTNFNTTPKHLKEKARFYKYLKNRKRMEKYRDKANSEFKKKIELFSNFNRLVLYDGAHWHASRNADNDKSERLTLITFFKQVEGKDIRYPITQMRRI